MVTTDPHGGAYDSMDMNTENLIHAAAYLFPDKTAGMADGS
jgi:hypothetical protein